MLEGLLDRPPFHPILLRNHMTSQMLTHLAGLVFYTRYFHQLLHKVEEETEEKRGKSGDSVSRAGCRLHGKCVVSLMFAWTSSARSAPKAALCSGSFFTAASRSSTASLPSVSTATPSTNKPRQCPRQTVTEGIETLSAVATLRKKEADTSKKTGPKNEKDFGWCLSLLLSFLFASAIDCVPAQLTSAVLHFNSIPSGWDHSTAETPKV